MKTCKVKIHNASAYSLPQYQTAGAAGADLYANIDTPLVLEPRKVYAVPTGISIELPVGYEAQIRARSGLALKHGITLVNGIGTVDSDYRGEIKVILMNLKEEAYTVNPGDRIAQMVIQEYVTADFCEVEDVAELTKTERDDGGFGHSGL
ncbi:MAG: dUTP diphosphatase [Eubacterium sp.]|nr:dUTP diphosphatase [Eubacterium sp.]